MPVPYWRTPPAARYGGGSEAAELFVQWIEQTAGLEPMVANNYRDWTAEDFGKLRSHLDEMTAKSLAGSGLKENGNL